MKLAPLLEGGVPSRRLGLMFQHVAEEDYDEELDVFISDGFTVIHSPKMSSDDRYRATGVATDGRYMWYVNAAVAKEEGAKTALTLDPQAKIIPQVSELETIAWIKDELARWVFD